MILGPIIDQQRDSSLDLPRILCLHGGGTNAQIFSKQCRVLRKQLALHFRLCFAEAPFPSEPGSDVVAAYKDFGPFRRWLRWLPSHPPIAADASIDAIDESLSRAMLADDARGATGKWVGILGFSQGAKVAASILLRQQIRAKKLGKHDFYGPNFSFGILIACRGPLVSFEPGLLESPALVQASENTMLDVPWEYASIIQDDHIVQVPTIHVHGLRDPHLHLHKRLLERYFSKGSNQLIKWDGNHRVPIKGQDVAAIVAAIHSVAGDSLVWR